MNENPDRYRSFIKLTDIIPVFGSGIVTARDGITIQHTMDEMIRTVGDLAVMSEQEALKAFDIKEDTQDWKLPKAQADIRESGPSKGKLAHILYRPFDYRYTYYTGRSRGFISMPRREVMRQMLLENIALVTTRQVAEKEYNHCIVTDTIVDGRLTSSGKGICHLFPLYLYRESQDKYDNIKTGFLHRLQKQMKVAIGIEAEKVFYYVYAVLFSPTYRNNYSRYLKTDFPRIPFPDDGELFYQMAGLGELLARAHLLKSTELDKNSVEFKGGKSRKVDFVRFSLETSDSGKVYLNNKNFIPGIPLDIWEYRMCGYSVLSKLLDGYNGRILSSADMEHVSRVINSLQLTIEYQGRIDEIYGQIEQSQKVHPLSKTGVGFGNGSKTSKSKDEAPLSEQVVEMLFDLSPLDASQLNANEIAQRLGVDINTLINSFRSDSGRTMTGYLVFLRLTMSAIYLVAYPKAPLLKVGEKFGYSRTDYYTKHFKKLFGVTPAKFRERWFHHMGKKNNQE